ncbi:MAG: MFS transporter [Bdellovibrionota bacterium]
MGIIARTLIGISYLTGFLVSLQFIKSQAVFLAHYSAKELVFAVIYPVALWFFISFAIRKNEFRNQFVKTFIPVFICAAIILCSVITQVEKNINYVFVWIFMAGLFSELMRWGLNEMLERYVSPSKLGVVFSYQAMAQEVGIVSAVAFYAFAPHVSLLQVSLTTAVAAICILGILITFLNPRRLEFHFIARKSKDFKFFDKAYQPIFLSFLLMGLFAGVFRMSQDNLVNDFFKSHTLNQVELQKIISSAMLIGSFLQMIAAFINGRIIERNRVSPIRVIASTWAVHFAVGVFAIVTQTLWGHILFMSMSKGLAGFYYPALNRLSGSFKYLTGLTFKSNHIFGTIIFAGIVFAFIPHGPMVLPVVLVATFLLVLGQLLILRKKMIPTLEENIKSEHVDESVRAAIGLSYLQPDDYVEKMSEILDEKPPQLLKKQIILGLGYSHDPKSYDVLLQEFRSDKEEIQITVLEALKVAKSYKATRFALDLVLSNRKSLTPRVRLNAAQMVVALYGEKSIPILMLGLQLEDPRQLANVLEALSQFKHLELVDIFKGFVNSATPRVRANALMGLSQFPDQKEFYKEEILKTLGAPGMEELGHKISIFYLIGKNKNQEFKDTLIRLLIAQIKQPEEYKNLDAQSLSYIQTLSWSLLRLGVKEGRDVFFDLLQVTYRQPKAMSLLHFILQLDQNERYDTLDQWINESETPPATRDMLLDYFEKSGFNLEEEIEYLKSMNLVKF